MNGIHKHGVSTGLCTNCTDVTTNVVAVDRDLLKSSTAVIHLGKGGASDVSPIRVVGRILKFDVQGRSGAAASLRVEDDNGFTFSIITANSSALKIKAGAGSSSGAGISAKEAAEEVLDPKLWIIGLSPFGSGFYRI